MQINFSCVNVIFFLIRISVTLVTIILDFYVVLVSKLETIALKKLCTTWHCRMIFLTLPPKDSSVFAKIIILPSPWKLVPDSIVVLGTMWEDSTRKICWLVPRCWRSRKNNNIYCGQPMIFGGPVFIDKRLTCYAL